MDAEIPKNEIVDRFERRPGDPAVVPADLDMNAGDFADEARAHCFPDVGEMRRPAAVLIDRELHFASRRQFDEFAPVVEVLDERLLRQDMLSRIQRAAHEVDRTSGWVVMSRTRRLESLSRDSKSSVMCAFGK